MNIFYRLPRIVVASLAAFCVSALMLGVCITAAGGLASRAAPLASHESVLNFVGETLMLTAVMMGILVYSVFWQSVLAILVSELTSLRTWVYFVLVGFVLAHSAAVSHGIRPFSADSVEIGPFTKGGLNYLYLLAITSGVGGGLTYWLVAHRRTQ